MTTARVGHTATLLADGRVLIAGGIDDAAAATATAEIYDPTTGTSSPTGPMGTARFAHVAVRLADGRVLVAGGADLDSAEIYDPSSDTFTPTGSMSESRSTFTATVLPSGKVLVAGGMVGFGTVIRQSAELFDPGADGGIGAFSPLGLMNEPRTQHTATLLGNGKVLITGGSRAPADVLSNAELFDPDLGPFTPIASTMSAPRAVHQATKLLSGKVLVSGWSGGAADLYDPTTNTFTSTGTAGSPSRYGAGSVLLPTGKVLLAGGTIGSDSAELYDPETGFFSFTGAPAVLRSSQLFAAFACCSSSLPALLLGNGKVLLPGGLNPSTGQALDSAELYKPEGGIIDFDTFPDGSAVLSGTLITTQYAGAGAVFSSTNGGPATATNGTEASSLPNFLIGRPDSYQPITVDVVDPGTGSPATVSRIDATLISVGDSVVTATAFASDLTTVLDSVSVTNPGTGAGVNNKDLISLTGPGIARVTFAITVLVVGDGFGIDDLLIFGLPAAAPTLADLSITKTVSPTSGTSPEGNITYTVTVTNNGPAEATGVQLTDTLPTYINLDFVSITPSQGTCNQAGSTVTCSLGTIPQGASATATIGVHPIGTSLTNTASVVANETDPNPANNTASVSTSLTAVGLADLRVTKTDSPDPAVVGSPLTYVVTVTNVQDDCAYNVTLTDTLPAGVALLSVTPSQGFCVGLECNLATLCPTQSASVTIVVVPTAPGTITNTASVPNRPEDPDRPGGENTATATTTVTAVGAIFGFISGKVTQADGVTPISDATVIADPNPGTFGSAVTAADGSYTITGVAAGSYRVRAQAAGFGTRWYNGKTNFSSADLVAVTAGAMTTGIDFALPAGAGGFSGRVTQSDGVSGIPNAGVSVHQATTGTFVLFVTADGNGFYTTGLTLDPGSYKAQAQKDGFVSRWFGGVTTILEAALIAVTAGSDTPGINFQLPAGAGGIRGRVTRVDTSAPLAGVIVDVFDSGTGSFVVGGFRTAGDGTYSTGLRLAAGTYKIRARLTGFIDTFYSNGVDFTSATLVNVAANADTTNIDVALLPGGTISGTIRNRSTTAPIAGATVAAFRFAGAGFFSVTTDSNGNFAFQGLRDGEWLVRATKTGYILGYYSGDPNDLATDTGTATPIRISGGNTVAASMNLQPGGGTLRGTVTRSDNGQPVGLVPVNLNGLFPRLFITGFVNSTTTNASGEYEFTGLPTGQYIVSAQGRQEAAGTAIGFFPTGAANFSAALPVSVTDGAITSGKDFAIPAFGGTDTPRIISGTVRDSSGIPIPFAQVAAFDPFSQNFIRSVNVSGNGFYMLDRLPLGNYLVRAFTETTYQTAWHDGQHLAAAATPVDVTGGNQTVDFAMPATAGIITGRVTRSDTGLPVASAGIQVRNFFDNSLGGATTRQDGTFLIRGLPPGFYKVRVNAPGFVTRYYTSSGTGGTTADDASFVEVTSGVELPNVNIVVVPGAGSITGTVRQGLQAVPNAAVSIREATSGGIVVTLIAAQDGSYEAPILATGSYKLRASALAKPLEWFSGKDTRDQADPIAVTAPGTTSPIDFALSPTQGSISGQIFRSDGVTPLADAGVVVFDAATGGFIIGGGVTDTQGRYIVRSLPPGANRYVAQARALGFAPQFFAGAPNAGAATPISVGSDTPGINFTLPLTSTITGTISYGGSQTGPLRIGLFSDPALTQLVYGRVISSPVFPQAYSFSLPPPDTQGILPGTYFVAAFIDSNGNGAHDAGEAAGQFGAATPHGGTPVVVGENVTLSGRDFALADPAGPVVGTAISGRVTEEDGVTPIQGATVTTFPDAAGTAASALTEADGTYTIAGLSPGNYRVQAQADSFVTQWFSRKATLQSADLVVAQPGARTSGVDFALAAAAGGIGGQVTDGSTGIPNVAVVVRPVNGGFSLSTTTDAGGNYNTGRRLAPGNYKVQATGASGFGALFYDAKLTLAAADSVPVSPGSDTTGINFNLPGSVGGISGVVTDADTGAPVDGAVVQVFDAATNGLVLGRVVTQSDGTYATGQRLLAPGTYKVQASFAGRASAFYANKPNLGTADPVTVNVGADTANVNIALAPGGITGRVTSAVTGTPIAGATIDLFDAATGMLAFGGFTTALDGTFSTGEFVPAGTYKVRVRALGFADRFYVNGTDLLSATPVTRLAGQNTPNVNIALPLVGTIRGTVLDRSTGLPIVGAFVATFRVIGAGLFGTTTDAAGNFTFAGVPDGEWLVRATAAGHILGLFSGDPNNPATDNSTATPIRISGGSTAIADLNLRPGGGTLSGRVTRSDNPSQGVAGTSVNVSGLFPRLFWTGFVNGTVTDGNGYYTLTGLPTGHYVVQAAGQQISGGTATGFYPTGAANFGTALPVSVTDGATTSGADFAIPGFTAPDAPRTISGTVHDSSGSPIAVAGVNAIDPFTTLPVRFAPTNSDGSYTLTGLPPGKYVIRVATERTFQTTFYNGQHVAVAGGPVDVTSGNATGIDFSLPADAGTMTGRVTRSDTGQPIMGALVQVRNFFDNGFGGATSRRDGTFLVRGLPPGFYKGRVSAPGFVTRYFTVSGSGGAAFDNGSFIAVTGSQNTPDINVSLDPGPGSITGTVRRQEDLQPLGNALVQVRDAASGSTVFIAVTAVDGSYELPILATGTYKLRAIALDRATQWFSGKDTREAGDSVSVTAPGTMTADFALSPIQGSISGQVFRSDGVTPLADAGVLVFDAATGGLVVGSGVTDTQGRYTVRGLPPGANRYVAQARALGFAPQFFAGAPNAGAATPISVGSDTPGINFTLPLTSTITGTISYFGSQTGPLRVGLFSDPDLTRQVYETTIPSPAFPRAYSFSLPPPDSQGILPGTYYVAAFIDGNGNRVRDAGEAAGQFGGASATAVIVTEGSSPAANLTLLDAPLLPLVSADLSLTKVESAGQVLSGSTLLYTLRVQNAGPNAALSVSLADAIPAGTTFASATTDQGTCSTPAVGGTGTVLCSLGDVASDDTVTVTLLVNVAAAAGATITNTASVTTATPDPNPANNSDTAITTVVSSTLGSISGRVTQADGVTPIVGATVSASPVMGGTVPPPVGTDASGNYTIPGVAQGHYRVQAQAPNFSTVWFNGRISAGSADFVAVTGGLTTTGIDFSLPAGGTITGTVTNAVGGAPLTGATIDIFDAFGAFVQGGFVSASGPSPGDPATYSTGPRLPPGVYKVRARLAGFATTFHSGKHTFGTADLVVLQAGGTQTVNFQLGAGFAISGRIRDASGNGLGNATIDILEAGTNNFVDGGFTSAIAPTPANEGNYTTSQRLPPGRYTVRVRLNNFGIAFYNGKSTFDTADPVTVGPDQSGIDITLAAGGGITGTVYRSDTGAPVAGASISIFDAATNTFLFGGGLTNASGAYNTQRILSPARTYKVVARFPGLLDTFHGGGVDLFSATSISVTPGADTPGKDIMMPVGGTIAGRILERGTGAPIAGANVFAFRFAAASFFGAFGVLTDTNGNFVIRGLHDGEWVVRAETAGHITAYYSGDADNAATDMQTATPIAISAAGSVANVNINLLPGGGVIRGLITRADTGQPVPAGTGVSLRTFPRVNFITSVATSSFNLCPGAPTPCNYVLPAAAPGDYVVEAIGAPTESETAVGWYRLPAPGALGSATRGSALPLSVNAGGTTTADFGIPVPAGGARTISGTIRDATGRPVRFAEVGAFEPASQSVVRFVNANGDGSYLLNHLPPGKYLVRADTETTYQTTFYNGQQILAAGAIVDVTGSNATGIDFVLPDTAGTITGRITDAGGNPIMGAGVSIRNFFDNTVGGAVTRADGTYLVRGLPAGVYKVRVSAPGFITRHYRCGTPPCATSTGPGLTSDDATFITVVSGENTGNINLALDPGGGAIAGTVLKQGSADPVVSALVQVREATSGATVFTVSTFVDGTYAIPGLPTGNYKLRAFSLMPDVPDPLLPGFATQWFDAKPTREAADVVAVTAPGTVADVNFLVSTTRGSISGRVFRSDGITPLADAGVVVFEASTGGFVRGGGNTDTQGRYTVPGLTPGLYLAQARALGFAPKFFADAPSAGSATPITVASDTPGINFTLTRSSDIQGAISYTGAQTGPLVVDLFADLALTQRVYRRVIPSPVYPQPYSFSLPPPDTQGIIPGTYFVAAFIDSIGNGSRDASEAAGQFGGAPPIPVVVGENDIQGSRDFTLFDPVVSPGTADLSLLISQSLVGATIEYTLTVTNAGPDTATDVTVTEPVPAGTTFAIATPSQGSCTTPPVGGTGTVSCSLGDLLSGGSATVSLVVNVVAAAGATISNTASVAAATADPFTLNNLAVEALILPGLDSDGDGVDDSVDNCPFTFNPAQTDTDRDGIGDACDADIDGDGVPNAVDNCPLAYNPGQGDFDGDGIGDACDPDADGDGYVGVEKIDPLTGLPGTDCDDADPNVFPGQGCGAAVPPEPERTRSTSTTTVTDTDGDGVPDSSDNCPKTSNPKTTWTDKNGVLHTDSQPDFDLDGKGDACDTDQDGDGVADKVEDPAGSGTFRALTVAEGGDSCPTKPNPKANWTDKNGVAHVNEQPDFDLDGKGDACDEDADGDGFNAIAFGGTDCNDLDPAVNPGMTEILNNGKDDDCNPATADKAFDIVFSLAGDNYDAWLPTDGAAATIVATVVDSSGNPISPQPTINLSIVSITNFPGKYTNDPNVADTSPDVVVGPIGGNQMPLTFRDYGGLIAFRATTTFTLADGLGTTISLEKTGSLPKDLNGNGIADAWEHLYGGNLSPGADDDTSQANTNKGDGLTVFKEYRGFKWGPALVRIDPVASAGQYQTPAFVPSGPAGHFRTNPTRKDLFLLKSGFTTPFAIGAAFDNAGIDIHVRDALDPNPGDQNIDVLVLNNVNRNFGLQDGRINWRAPRDWTWDTKGVTDITGTSTAFGAVTTFQFPLDFYFNDHPYRDGGAGTTVARNNMLDPLSAVEDGNDNGQGPETIKGKSEDKNANGVLDGDFRILGWENNPQHMSPFDVDNDGRVELPIVSVVTASTIQYTKAQVQKHTITHEIGHAIGLLHNSCSTCLMYEFTNSWSRDEQLDSLEASQALIHNRP